MKWLCKIFDHKPGTTISGSVMTNWTIIECMRCGKRLGDWNDEGMEKYKDRIRRRWRL